MDTEIVVGIDYGTTYSGASWAINKGKKTIRLISNWPNPVSLNSTQDKVPSTISYHDGYAHKWGYSIELEDDSINWVKLLLEPGYKYNKGIQPVQKSQQLLEKLGKTGQDVVSDYLRLIWEYVKSDIRRFHEDFETTFSLRVVLTCPAIWTPAARDRTLQAARAAGFPQDRIAIVTEPEAASLAVLKDRAEEDMLKIGDVFIVCDAGGGTVDLISYEIKGLCPLRVSECAIGDGYPCGSVFLDDAFEKSIERKVGVSNYLKIKDINRKKMMREFERSIKRSFTGNDDRPYSVDLKGIGDDEKKGILDDTITLQSPMLRTVFDHIVGQIIALIELQIDEISEKKLVAKAIMLVGGFGENVYLHSRLSSTFGQKQVKVLQVTGAWSAVCRGATLWGLENPLPSPSLNNSMSHISTISSRLARYSYGVVVNAPFNAAIHLESEKMTDTPDGVVRARSQMLWLMRRGDEIKDGRVFSCETLQFARVRKLDWGTVDLESTLYYCDEKSPPTRYNSGNAPVSTIKLSRSLLKHPDVVKVLCTVRFECKKSTVYRHDHSFKNVVNNQTMRKVGYTLLIQLGSATLDFAVKYHGDYAGKVTASYPEQS